MKLKFLSLLIISFISFNLIAQNNFTISGYVQEDESGENLIGVSIYDKKLLKVQLQTNMVFIL